MLGGGYPPPLVQTWSPLVLALLAVRAPMLVSVVSMNYHFVGDVVAGGCLGGIVGAYAAQIANLEALGGSMFGNGSPKRHNIMHLVAAAVAATCE